MPILPLPGKFKGMMDGTIIWQITIEGLQVSEFILFLGFLQKLEGKKHQVLPTDAALVRLFPAQYMDGVYLPRQEPHLPNPRKISNIATSGQSGLMSYRNRSVLSVAFGEWRFHLNKAHFNKGGKFTLKG